MLTMRIMIIFLGLFIHELQEYLILIEKCPDPLVSYISHSSHKAPICPVEQELSPYVQPPLQFPSKLIH